MAETQKRKLKPLYLTWQPGISRRELKGVFDGLETMKRILARTGKFHGWEVRTKGAWRKFWIRDWRWNLIPGESMAWVVEHARTSAVLHKKGREYLFANAIHSWQKHNPWQEGDPHHHLTVVKNNLYSQSGGFFDDCVGVCFCDYGNAVLSLERSSKLTRKERDIFNWAVTIHEVGHILDAVPDGSREAAKDFGRSGPHCLNECVMQKSLSVDECVKLWQKPYPFCTVCLRCIERYAISNSSP